jgi:hypothetical protein
MKARHAAFEYLGKPELWQDIPGSSLRNEMSDELPVSVAFNGFSASVFSV